MYNSASRKIRRLLKNSGLELFPKVISQWLSFTLSLQCRGCDAQEVCLLLQLTLILKTKKVAHNLPFFFSVANTAPFSNFICNSVERWA